MYISAEDRRERYTEPSIAFYPRGERIDTSQDDQKSLIVIITPSTSSLDQSRDRTKV